MLRFCNKTLSLHKSFHSEFFSLRSIFACPLYLADHVLNLTEELSTARKQRLNQFGTAVLISYGKNVQFDRVSHIIRHSSGRLFIRRSSHVPNQMHTL